jgi:hypothetical protein
MTSAANPAATDHIPWFLASPDGSDGMMIATALIVAIVVFMLGVVFFRLHSLPERLGHKKLQFEIVAVLGLLSLFTHVHLFWVIGLFLALVDLPDFTTPLGRIARSLETMSGSPPPPDENPPQPKKES